MAGGSKNRTEIEIEIESGLIVINSLSVVRQVAAGGRKFAVPLLSRFSMKALERKPKLLLLLVASSLEIVGIF